MRKALIVLIVLVGLGASGFFGYQEYQRRQAAAQTPDFETIQVERSDISATVSATGVIQPEREVSLPLKSGGSIVEVRVQVGDLVKAGDVLARLDTADLELAVRQAEIGLQQAEAQLAQLREGPSEVDVAAAQAALDSAKAAYNQALRGPDNDQLAAAQAQVDQAKVQVDQAQQAYDRVRDRPDVGLLPQSLQLQQATIAYETALANYRVAARPTNASQISAAQAQVAQAQASLDRLGRGPSPAQVAVAEAGIEQARLAVEQAQRRVSDASLLAPWDGLVTAVTAVAGAVAQPGQPAIQLADTSQYHLDVQVDEIDIAGIKPGQPVTIEIDALPEQPLSGRVAVISPTAQRLQTGGVSYSVRLGIDPSDAPLRAGMSATATIIASSRQDVLVVPNRAVQLDRESGRTFVERVVGPTETQRVEVRLGLRDDQQSEVREGLGEGDQIGVYTRSSLQRLQEQFGGF
jgi:HlyD family secretion protein